MARSQKKEGFTQTPLNRYVPSSSLSNEIRGTMTKWQPQRFPTDFYAMAICQEVVLKGWSEMREPQIVVLQRGLLERGRFGLLSPTHPPFFDPTRVRWNFLAKGDMGKREVTTRKLLALLGPKTWGTVLSKKLPTDAILLGIVFLATFKMIETLWSVGMDGWLLRCITSGNHPQTPRQVPPLRTLRPLSALKTPQSSQTLNLSKICFEGCSQGPKESFEAFLWNNLSRQNVTSEIESNLKRLLCSGRGGFPLGLSSLVCC